MITKRALERFRLSVCPSVHPSANILYFFHNTSIASSRIFFFRNRVHTTSEFVLKPDYVLELSFLE